MPSVILQIGATTRVTITRDPLSRRSPYVKQKGPVYYLRIRKQRTKPFEVSKLLQLGSIGPYEAELMPLAIKYGARVLFFGGTNSGKTGSMTTFCQGIPNDKSVITIAEVDEMNLLKIDTKEFITDGTGKEIRNPNYMRPINFVLMMEVPDQTKQITTAAKGFKGALRLALTMTPQVIIMQEAKGTEMAEILEAAQTGHQVLTTMHADNYKIVSDRIIQMIIQALGLPASEIKRQIASAFDIFCGLEKLDDGSRKVTSITEVVGINEDTGEIEFRELSKFKVTNVVRVNGKKKIEGHFAAVDPISEVLIDRFRRVGGITDEDLKPLNRLYQEHKVSK